MFGVLRLLEHVVPAVADDRGDDDRVDALVDEAADGRDLRCRLVVGGVEVRSKPFSLEKAFFMDSVFALRQPDSEPVCAKPTLIGLPAGLVLPLGVLAPPPEEPAAGCDDRQGPHQGDTG